ncbi:hypothetical protein B9Z55_019821 [Caenorhabditis nigoni]|uniref:Uncharacterized protein n=1 Tax=Caenorhabditis nigoni TaxID=1611254 RepID=A0A2G5TKS7_9PELO|nr:hypothetical protein B9Z55_019821 [Caenorhabditis nigoni]
MNEFEGKKNICDLRESLPKWWKNQGFEKKKKNQYSVCNVQVTGSLVLGARKSTKAPFCEFAGVLVFGTLQHPVLREQLRRHVPGLVGFESRWREQQNRVKGRKSAESPVAGGVQKFSCNFDKIPGVYGMSPEVSNGRRNVKDL